MTEVNKKQKQSESTDPDIDGYTVLHAVLLKSINMKRSKEKVTVRWSKKEKDWVSKYPEWENRNARITGNAFFDMIRKFEEFMSKDWQGKPTGFTNFRDYLSSGGFDPDTFTISVNAKVKDDVS